MSTWGTFPWQKLVSVSVWALWLLFSDCPEVFSVSFSSLLVPSRYVRSPSFWILNFGIITCTHFLISKDKNSDKKSGIQQFPLFSSEVVKNPTAADFNVLVFFALEKCFLLSSVGSTLLFSSYAEQNLSQNRGKHQLLIRHKLFLIYTQCLIPGSQKCKLCFKNNMWTSHLFPEDRSPSSI